MDDCRQLASQPEITPRNQCLDSAGLFVLFIGATIGLGSWWLSRHQTSWLVAALMGLTILKFPLVAGLKIDPTSDFWNYHTLAAFSAQGFTWTQLLHHGIVGNYVVFPHALNMVDCKINPNSVRTKKTSFL